MSTKTLDDIFADLEAAIDECGPEADGPAEHELEVIKAADRFLASIIPPEITETRTDHPEFNRGGWERIRQGWSPIDPAWLWIHSEKSGRSKTRVAYLATREWALVHYRKMPLDKIKGMIPPPPSLLWLEGYTFAEACRVRHQYTLGDAQPEAHKLVRQAKETRLLVLDDLTKRKIQTEAVSDGFWELIEHRHKWRLPTIITDNSKIDDLEACLHPKHAGYIMRRLGERCQEADFDR